MQGFARVSFLGRFLAQKRHLAAGQIRIKPLVERCAGLRSEKRSLRPALNSCAYTIKTEVSLGGGPPTVSTLLISLAHSGEKYTLSSLATRCSASLERNRMSSFLLRKQSKREDWVHLPKLNSYLWIFVHLLLREVALEPKMQDC